MKTAEGAPDVGEARGESDGRVSPSRIKESGLGAGLAAGLVGVGVVVRLGGGVLGGAVFGVRAIVVASARAVGVAVNSVTIGTAVGGVSTGKQPVKRLTVRYNASQILATNC
jgi:hypothetical protein